MCFTYFTYKKYDYRIIIIANCVIHLYHTVIYVIYLINFNLTFKINNVKIN